MCFHTVCPTIFKGNDIDMAYLGRTFAILTRLPLESPAVATPWRYLQCRVS